MQQVYLNGRYMDEREACIPVLDRGFMFGDGVYEVIPVYGGRVFRQKEHLERLQRSLDAVEIHCPECDLAQIFARLIASNLGQADGSIYLQITRGVMHKREHVFNDQLTPTVLAMCRSHDFTEQSRDTPGIQAITLEDNRWADCFIKSTNLLPNVLNKQHALNAGAGEAILIRNGQALEGTASNLFVVKQDIVRTPPKSRFMLGGITREVIIELCRENKMVLQEKPVSEDELHDADEIWMTSSTREIMPVTMLNRHKVGKGIPGPQWLRMIELYQAFKQKVMRG